MLKKIVAAFVLFGLMLITTSGILIYSKWSDDNPKYEKIQYLIILGAKVRQEGVSPTLQRRLDKTLPVLKKDTNIIVIVSGGKGDDEPISEAKAMSDYLIAKGIKPSRILSEDQSFSTEENLHYSRKKLNIHNNQTISIFLSTSNYHQYRAQKLAAKFGFKSYGLASSTPTNELPFRIGREMVAIMKMRVTQ
jgi:uncharacterized SAM-binding protein YcdF (DUF218 family)